MLNITCTTDPISGKEVSRGADQPNVHELGNETDLLDNPTDEYIDEG